MKVLHENDFFSLHKTSHVMGVAFVAAILQVAGAAGKPAVLPSVGTARLTDVAAIPVLVDSSEMRLTYAAGLVVPISC